MTNEWMMMIMNDDYHIDDGDDLKIDSEDIDYV